MWVGRQKPKQWVQGQFNWKETIVHNGFTKGDSSSQQRLLLQALIAGTQPIGLFRFEITTLTKRFQKRWTLCGWVNPYQISSEVPWSHHTTAVDMKCELTLHRTVAVTKQTMFPKSCFDVFWAYIHNCTASLFLPHWDNNFPLSKIDYFQPVHAFKAPFFISVRVPTSKLNPSTLAAQTNRLIMITMPTH